MAEIRPFTHADVPLVVALLRAHMPGWPLDERALVGLMLDHPWADEELPSLVALEGDEIVGFTGVQARRMRMDGGPIRGACCTHAVVNPAHRGGAVGALLLSRILSGPQAVTWADSATDPVAAVYRIMGGHLDFVRACDWMLVLRPVRWLSGIAVAAARREAVSRRTFVPVGAIPVQAAGRRLLKQAHPEPTRDVRGEDHRPQPSRSTSPRSTSSGVSGSTTTRRSWTTSSGSWRFFEGRSSVASFGAASAPSAGMRTFFGRGARAGVLHLAAPERDVDAVLGELVSTRASTKRGAHGTGGTAYAGCARAAVRRPRLRAPADDPREDPELAAVMATSAALLTRFEGEVFGI